MTTNDPYQQFIQQRMASGQSLESIVDSLTLAATAPKCRFCDLPSVNLCDFWIARCKSTMEELTCSAPICLNCTTNVGHTFCRGEGGCEIMTDDLCPDHKREAVWTAPRILTSYGKLRRMEEEGLGVILLRSASPFQMIFDTLPAPGASR